MRTNISTVFINSLSAHVKIAVSEYRYNMLGEKYYDNKKYQGISRPHPREKNGFPSIRHGSPVSGSITAALHIEKEITVHLKRNKSQDDKEQTAFLLHSAQHKEEQNLHPNHTLSSSKHDSSIVAL